MWMIFTNGMFGAIFVIVFAIGMAFVVPYLIVTNKDVQDSTKYLLFGYWADRRKANAKLREEKKGMTKQEKFELIAKREDAKRQARLNRPLTPKQEREKMYNEFLEEHEKTLTEIKKVKQELNI